MVNIKDLFSNAENGMLTFEQFEEAAKAAGAKFADLSDGKYVSKSKYDADLKEKDEAMTALNTQISDLNGTITTRDSDLEGLKKQLEEAGQSATKLAELNSQFANLQSKYENDTKEYQAKMDQQAYEFASQRFADSQKFTSKAAKRDFTAALIARKLQMENGKLVGGDDFVKSYSEENADAFLVEAPAPAQDPTPAPTPAPAAPIISASTPGAAQIKSPTSFDFGFRGVH